VSKGAPSFWVVRCGALALLVGAALACDRLRREEPSPPRFAERQGSWALAVVPPEGYECFDVGSRSACYSPGDVMVAPRLLPELAAPSELGFRCWTEAGGRRCVDRLRAAGPFVCTAKEGRRSCVQRAPRLPQGSIWDCGDVAGAVVCLGQDAPAAPPPDPGWKCGARRGAESGARVCVDLSPDYPNGISDDWACRFEDDPHAVGGRARTCVSEAGAPLLGATCDREHACVDGAQCLEGGCMPPEPLSDCIADQDCGAGVCRFGSCAARDGGEP
jgi:hypothetical protein